MKNYEGALAGALSSIFRESLMKKFYVILLITLFFIGCGNFGKIMVKRDTFKNSTVVTLKLKGRSAERNGGIFKYSREIGVTQIIPTKVSFNVSVDTTDEALADRAFVRIDNLQYELVVFDRGSQNRSSTTSTTTKETSDNSSGFKDYAMDNSQENGSLEYAGYEEQSAPTVYTNYEGQQPQLIMATFVDYTKQNSSSNSSGFIDYTKQNNSSSGNSAFTDYTKQNSSNNSSSDSSKTTTTTTVTTMHWKELTGTLRFNKEMEEKLSTASTMIFRLYSGSEPMTFTVSGQKLSTIKKFLKAGQEPQK